MNPTNATELVTASAQLLRQQAEARQRQVEHAKRVIGVVASTHGGSYVLKAVQEPTATEAQDVTVINGQT